MSHLRFPMARVLVLAAVVLSACAGGGSNPAVKAGAGPGGGQITPAGDEVDPQMAVAIRLVDAMAAGKYEKAARDFDETMRAVLAPEDLKATWEGLVSRTGPFQQRLQSRKETLGAIEFVFVRCLFEAGPLDVKVVISPKGEVSGLWFVPATPPQTYEPPPYARPDSYVERDVTVGAGEWVVPGTLTRPVGDGPFPAVVLVHGSGPNDRDETLGPNKPFRDLAWGLASQGIVVLRYEKRTRHYSSRLLAGGIRLTVKEETVDDAVAAVDLLRGTDGVDRKKLFVLGHSLGGMLAPRIGKRIDDLAGLVVLAGTTRPLEEVLMEQLRYLANLDGKVTESEQAQLDMIEEAVGAIQALDPEKPEGSPEKLLGVGPEYWLALRGYDAPKEASSLKVPMLILQGERDYQVTMVDFNNWRDALEGREDVKMKSYPPLNHLFLSGKGISTPDEYEKAGHVAEEVISDIAEWAKGL